MLEGSEKYLYCCADTIDPELAESTGITEEEEGFSKCIYKCNHAGVLYLNMKKLSEKASKLDSNLFRWPQLSRTADTR